MKWVRFSMFFLLVMGLFISNKVLASNCAFSGSKAAEVKETDSINDRMDEDLKDPGMPETMQAPTTDKMGKKVLPDVE